MPPSLPEQGAQTGSAATSLEISMCVGSQLPGSPPSDTNEQSSPLPKRANEAISMQYQALQIALTESMQQNLEFAQQINRMKDLQQEYPTKINTISIELNNCQQLLVNYSLGAAEDDRATVIET
jgi:hypothetical protein